LRLGLDKPPGKGADHGDEPKAQQKRYHASKHALIIAYFNNRSQAKTAHFNGYTEDQGSQRVPLGVVIA
jgi:hypothetical protein